MSYVHDCSYRFRGETNSSNMVVMEVTLPSGYTVDNDALPSLQGKDIKRVETKDGDSVVMLYFDKVNFGRRSTRTFATKSIRPPSICIYRSILYAISGKRFFPFCSPSLWGGRLSGTTLVYTSTAIIVIRMSRTIRYLF